MVARRNDIMTVNTLRHQNAVVADVEVPLFDLEQEIAELTAHPELFDADVSATQTIKGSKEKLKQLDTVLGALLQKKKDKELDANI